jgi:hypothetical protein
MVRQPFKGGFHHPAVNRAHDTIAFGGGNKRHGRHQFPFSSIIRTSTSRYGGSRMTFRYHAGNAKRFSSNACAMRDTLHFSVPDRNLAIIVLVQPDTIAAFLLGHVTGAVGASAPWRACRCAWIPTRPMETPTRKVLPAGKAEFLQRLEALVGNLVQPAGGTAFKQDTEFIAAKACQRVAVADQGA